MNEHDTDRADAVLDIAAFLAAAIRAALPSSTTQ